MLKTKICKLGFAVWITEYNDYVNQRYTLDYSHVTVQFTHYGLNTSHIYDFFFSSVIIKTE